MTRPTFGDTFDPQANAFLPLRLGLAILVVVSHALVIGGWDEPVGEWSHDQATLGSLAVDGFFAMSGFLVLASWRADPSVRRFLLRRALRIVPAFWVALLLVAFVLAPLWWWLEHGSLSAAVWTHSDGALAYLGASFHLRYDEERSIAELLLSVPFSGVVNAPLWTLQYEIACYAGLALLGGMRGLGRERPRFLPVAVVGGVCLRAFVDDDLLRLSGFFLAGMSLHAWRDRIPWDGRIAAACACALVVSLHLGGFAPVALIGIPYCVHYVACAPGLRGPRNRTDLSYGLYVYTFPVSQTLALLGLHHGGRWLFVLASLAGGGALGWLSHRFVEAPMLALKKWSVRKE